MKRCNNCHVEIDEQVKFCPYCGVVVSNPLILSADPPDTGYALLGFFLPVIGLVLWLLWKDEFPGRAKSSIKGVIYSMTTLFVSIVVYLIYILILLWLLPQ